MRRALLPLLTTLATAPLSAACHHTLPSALSLADPAAGPAEAPPVLATRDDALRYVLAGDPLARRPRLPAEGVLEAVPGAAALVATAAEIRRAEGGGHDLVGALKLMSDRRPGTETTAIARGYRLGLADRRLAALATDPADVLLQELAPLLSSLLRDDLAAQRVHQALDFLAEDDLPLPDAIRRAGDRWVLLGWLDGPDVPLGPVAEALAAPQYDLLRESRVGRLLLARAAGARSDSAAARADLDRATALALQKAAADRPHEQGAWSDTRHAAAAELHADDPIGFLLDRAADGFVADAGRPAATGEALVAIAARRLVGGCDWRPCRGLDRVDALAAALRFGPEVAPHVGAWRAIALKEALDTMDVGQDTVLFRRALTDLVDALLGTGAAPMSAGLLTRTAAEPEVWAQLGAAVGEPTTGTWEQARIALGRHLARVARQASETAVPSWRPWLDRIADRAAP